MHKCYSVCRSPNDENNDSVSKSWIVFRHGIVAKLTSAAEFSVAEDLAFVIYSALLYSAVIKAYRMNTLGLLTEVGTQLYHVISIAYHECEGRLGVKLSAVRVV